MSYTKLKADVVSFIEGSNHDLTRENANKSSTNVATHRDLLAGILSKHIMLEDELPKDIADWHKDGWGHYHDLDYALSPLTNCCLPNYPDMLENGFMIGDARIESPNSIGVASTVLTQIVQAVACSQYGGQTLAHIDRYLAPYVQRSYQKLLDKQQDYDLPDCWVEDTIREEVRDAMQALIYQVNSLCTTNGQSAFVTITFGLDTSRFGRMIVEEYLKQHMNGLGKHKTVPVFPKVVFVLQEGINLSKDDINYDLKQLSIKCSSTSIYPDYLSAPLIKEVTGCNSDVVSPMGCRSFLAQWKNADREEQLLGRMNLGVVSLNLPMYALQAHHNYQTFFEILDEQLEMAYKAQTYRVSRLLGVKASTNPTMFMIGVSWDKLGNKHKVRCRNPITHEREYLGLYESELEAHSVWRGRKLEIALELKPKMDAIDLRIYPNVVIISNNAK